MRIPLHCCLPLALLALASCSKPAPDVASSVPATAIAVASQDERKCTNEPRADESDNRPRCGGIGAPTSTKKSGYRITLDNGESFTACDITQPFSGQIGHGMVTMSFMPTDARSGTAAWHFANARGMADTGYDYALSGPEDDMTGTFRANAAICGKTAGLTACAAAQKQTFSSTWRRIDDCETGQ